MARQLNEDSREIKDTLRALRRAAKNALALGIQTGTPVYVIKDNKIVDLTKDESRGRKSQLRQT